MVGERHPSRQCANGNGLEDYRESTVGFRRYRASKIIIEVTQGYSGVLSIKRFLAIEHRDQWPHGCYSSGSAGNNPRAVVMTDAIECDPGQLNA
jgi:hypothetical protein